MKKDVQEAKHWATIQEAGTLFGLKFLWGIHKLFGRKAVSLLLYPTVIYFIIFKPASRAASLDFLRTHAQVYPKYWRRQPNILHSARHFLEFAETVVDKLLAWYVHIDADKFNIENPAVIEELMADQRGQLVIGTYGQFRVLPRFHATLS